MVAGVRRPATRRAGRRGAAQQPEPRSDRRAGQAGAQPDRRQPRRWTAPGQHRLRAVALAPIPGVAGAAGRRDDSAGHVVAGAGDAVLRGRPVRPDRRQYGRGRLRRRSGAGAAGVVAAVAGRRRGHRLVPVARNRRRTRSAGALDRAATRLGRHARAPLVARRYRRAGCRAQPRRTCNGPKRSRRAGCRPRPPGKRTGRADRQTADCSGHRSAAG